MSISPLLTVLTNAYQHAFTRVHAKAVFSVEMFSKLRNHLAINVEHIAAT